MIIFNRQRLANNINILIRIRNLGVKDVENAIGDSTGILSRFLHMNYTLEIPPVDLIFKLAKYFGVSTDMLIEGDFSKLTDDGLYFVPFLDWLKNMTENNQLRWECFPPFRVDLMLFGQEEGFFLVQETDDVADLAVNIVKTRSSFPCESGEVSDHAQKNPPADGNDFINHRIECDWKQGQHWAYGNRRVYSYFYPGNKVWMKNPCYRCEIDSETRISLFLMSVELLNPAYRKDTYNIPQSVFLDFFEVYFEKREPVTNPASSRGNQTEMIDFNWKVYPICNTSLNASGLWSTISALYNTIERCASNLVLDETVKSSIIKFMNAGPGFSF